MWESTVRLVGDDEAAHRALTQLKKAIRSRVTETELPEGSQLQLVSLTTSTVTAQLEQLAAVSGDTDQQRRQQLLLAMLPVIQSAISRAVSEHAMKVQQEHEASTMRQPGMHPLPAEVKDYFSAATDAAEATPEGNVRNDSESNPNCDDPGNKGQGKKKKLPRNKKGPTRPPRGGS